MQNNHKVRRRGLKQISLGYLDDYLNAASYRVIADELLTVMPVYLTLNGKTTQIRIKKGKQGLRRSRQRFGD